MKRIRVVQFGISHEHAVDKLTTILRMIGLPTS